MADSVEVEQQEAEVSKEATETVTAEVAEEVSAEVADSLDSEAAVPESATAEEVPEAEKIAEPDSPTPKENGDKNGVTASNGSSELKRKSLVVESGEAEAVTEKKAKSTEEAEIAENEAEAVNGIEAN